MAQTLLVRGDKEVLRKLKSLEPRLRRRAIVKASRIAIKPVVSRARANAPVKTGRLRKSIKVRSIKSRRGRVGVTVSTGAEGHWFKGKQFYGAFQEFGWKSGRRPGRHAMESGNDTRRQIPGKHYMEKAFDAEAPGVISSFSGILLVEIEKLKGG